MASPRPTADPTGVGRARVAAGLAVAGLVLGAAAIFSAWIPLCGVATVPVALLGLTLALAGLVVEVTGVGAKRLALPLIAVATAAGAAAMPYLVAESAARRAASQRQLDEVNAARGEARRQAAAAETRERRESLPDDVEPPEPAGPRLYLKDVTADALDEALRSDGFAKSPGATPTVYVRGEGSRAMRVEVWADAEGVWKVRGDVDAKGERRTADTFAFASSLAAAVPATSEAATSWIATAVARRDSVAADFGGAHFYTLRIAGRKVVVVRRQP